jgi:hypothetical protein
MAKDGEGQGEMGRVSRQVAADERTLAMPTKIT